MKKILLLLLLLTPTINHTQNLIQLAENNDYTGIVYAVQSSDTININMTDIAGFTALHVASWNGYIDIARYLLDKGANPNIVSKAGNTPLSFATPNIKNLLINYGAFEQDKNITLPRMLYSPNIYIESTTPPPLPPAPAPIPVPVPLPNMVISNIVSNIITNISNFIENTTYVSNTYRIFDYPKKSYNLLTNLSPVESIAIHNWDVDGNNSIHQAAQKGDLKKIQELVNRGVNPKTRNRIGDTALRFAAENNHQDIVVYLLETIGLDVNHANNAGTTALIIATFNNNPALIKYLGHMGANVNQTAQAAVNRTVNGEERESTVSNWTALMAASQLGYNESIEELLNNGANLNATDSDDWNALLFAVQNDHVSTAELLIERGINFNIESIDNHTPLSLAIDNGNEEMIKLLENIDAIKSSVPRVSYEESISELPTDGTYSYNDDENYTYSTEEEIIEDGYNTTTEE